MHIREKQRVDIVMVARGFAPSRQKARDIISNSSVMVEGKPVKKAGQLIRADALISIDTDILDYVSRGGLKLEKALNHFNEVEIADKICIDLGASTGGFTDVLLKRGAAFIYAVDVGHSQLAKTIRKNPKVRNLEKTNARLLDKNIIDTPPSIIVCDVSFISLQLALPPALALASPKADLLALIKPQFEVGKAFIGKGGVVRDENARNMAENSICCFLQEQGWHIRGTCPSPIEGTDGNRETLVAAFR